MEAIVTILDKKSLGKALSMREAIKAVEEYLRRRGRIKEVLPRRIVSNMGGEGVWLFMPAYVEGYGVAIKTINEYLRLKEKGLVHAHGMVELYDPETGRPLAVIDSPELTKLRTGALGGVAVKYLARRDSEVVGVIGSGNQAEAQLEAVLTLLKPSRVLVYSRRKERRERFANDVGKRLGVRITPVDNVDELVATSHILIAATNSSTPVLNGEVIRDGTHITSLGTLPDRRELDEKTFTRVDKVVFDLEEGVLREAGDVIHALKHGYLSKSKVVGELSSIVQGLKPGRESEQEVTLFKSVGFASLDVVVAYHAYVNARSRGVGVEVKL